VDVAVVIPNYNGARWLPAVLDSVAAQTLAPAEVLVVDDGSTDGSADLAEGRARVLRLGSNGGFARAANAGLAATGAEAIALVNTDVVLAPHWLEWAVGALGDGVASVATKMADLADSRILYSTGDILRRDGVAEQRGRFEVDKGFYDEGGEIFSACAGAALYRRAALAAVGGFDERLGMYLEDVELGLRLQLSGWRCAYEPVAYSQHAGGGSSGGPGPWVERNTLLIVARYFRLRWLPQVAYRQAAWLWHAARERRLREHLAGVRMALPLLREFARERREWEVPIEEVVPALPIRGRRAGGHRSRQRS
jgi:GT2 family glycosyltransferase